MTTSEMLAEAKRHPEAADTAPGRLGQLIAAVEYIEAGKPIREGSPHTRDARIGALQDWLTQNPMI